MRLRPFPLPAALTLILATLALIPQARAADVEHRFDVAWRLVAERYWDLSAVAVDWDEVGERYRPEALAAEDEDAFFAVLEAMYQELGDDHSVFVPPAKVAQMREQYGDLPCLAVFGAAGDVASSRAGPVAFELLQGDVGYLRVADLVSDGTAEGVRDAVTRLERLGADAFVLDLRGNPGGRLVTMMQVAGVFTQGFLWRAVTSWSLPIPYPALGRPATSAPLVVLVDGEVHSAAEGLAGALQHRGRALVVGATTAGNVEAVLPYCLRDGSQAWIATGVLAPIGGPTWEGRGVVPDVEVASHEALAAALRRLRAER